MGRILVALAVWMLQAMRRRGPRGNKACPNEFDLTQPFTTLFGQQSTNGWESLKLGFLFQDLQRPQPVGVRGSGQEIYVLQPAAVSEELS